ncbi:MAG: glucose 1-dehydrogenase [Thermoguttaceae bacterium]|jgi:NAD(P)-dependent dehydrogenase (short-subunit alcohol dehydrogenase family)|nr:glucose 1-dehydrogenase [Thermoguttaceae bacterium]
MNDPLFSVKDQVVLVSGASRGIGKAIAKGFADREANVIVTGRVQETIAQTAAELAGDRGNVYPRVCDVADPAAVGKLVEEIAAEFGRIDTLINCAGVNKRMRVEDYDVATYDFITNVNIRGAFFLAQACGRQMIKQGKGSIVNIDSINSQRPLNRVAPYAMSKGAMKEMTRCLAMEWGPHGVRVNSLGPGFTLTSLTRPLWESDKALDAWRDANTPLRRIGYPEDMVGTAIFLASDASAYVTGQIIYVDGGTTCGLFWPITVNKEP